MIAVDTLPGCVVAQFGDADATFSVEMRPQAARTLARALIDAADDLDGGR